MSVVQTICTIIQIIASVVLIVVITLQSGKSDGLAGAIGGGSDSFFSKNKAATLDGKLASATKWIAVVFIVLTLAINLLIG